MYDPPGGKSNSYIDTDTVLSAKFSVNCMIFFNFYVFIGLTREVEGSARLGFTQSLHSLSDFVCLAAGNEKVCSDVCAKFYFKSQFLKFQIDFII